MAACRSSRSLKYPCPSLLTGKVYRPSLHTQFTGKVRCEVNSPVYRPSLQAQFTYPVYRLVCRPILRFCLQVRIQAIGP